VAERRVRVVFDAHALSPHRSGIGEYSWHLIHAMLETCHAQVDLHLYVPSGIHPVHDDRDVTRLTAAVRDGDFFRASHQWRLPRLLRHGGYDLLHTPDFLVPLICPVPIVSTVHDIIPIVHPEFIPRSMKVRLLPLFRAWARRAVSGSAAVLTVSEHSKGDLVRRLGADPARIVVIPAAPTLEPAGGPLPARLAASLPAGKYFLYVGRADPYKGLAHLLRAFARARRDHGLADLRLAVAGKLDARYEYRSLAAELGIDAQVVFLDYVDGTTLSALHAHALAYVHPSLYEGFGVPPLDAMRHGTPVVCSDRSALPEVAGDAALFVDPEHVGIFSDALREIAENATLRRDLVRKGFLNVRRYSWNQTAKDTVSVYMRIASRFACPDHSRTHDAA
jgi:glycosyltransferase involved in cell wall biosynthesis